MKSQRPKPPVEKPVPPAYPFATNCHYENMKGTYEVLSISGGTMRIRYENGDEMDTDVEFQGRILSRIDRELRAVKAGRRAQDDPEHCHRDRFLGLTPADFSLEVPRTTWRLRTSGLGSTVTQELDAGDLCLGFWVPFGEPLIQWADLDKRKRSTSRLHTGFFCRLDESRACYGFFVERSTEPGADGDWHRFVEWLSAPGHDEWFRSIAATNGLKLFDPRDACSFPGFLQASETGWVWVDEERRKVAPSLSGFLSALPDEPPAAIECAAAIQKDRAVGRTHKLGRDIALLFEMLMPLYCASVGAAQPKKASPSRAGRGTRRPRARGLHGLPTRSADRPSTEIGV